MTSAFDTSCFHVFTESDEPIPTWSMDMVGHQMLPAVRSDKKHISFITFSNSKILWTSVAFFEYILEWCWNIFYSKILCNIWNYLIQLLFWKIFPENCECMNCLDMSCSVQHGPRIHGIQKILSYVLCVCKKIQCNMDFDYIICSLTAWFPLQIMFKWFKCLYSIYIHSIYIYIQYIYIYTTPYTNPRCTNRRSPNSPLLVASGHEAKLRVAIGFVHHLPSFGTLWLCQQFAIENGHRNSRFSQ